MNKRLKLVAVMVVSALITMPVFAQDNKDTAANTDGSFEQMMEYSRPGKNHQLLADYIGSWTFKGRHYSGNSNPDSNKVELEFKGSIVRKSFAYGRYFIVEFTGGSKIPLPVKDGKTVDGFPLGIETEGFNNVKHKFVKTLIGNHLGSDIMYSEGDYDSSTKTIIYQGVVSIVPGMNWKVYEHRVLVDKDHYTLEVYRREAEGFIKLTAMDFTRANKK
jgi:Protein of unknown function (DUF1579)